MQKHLIDRVVLGVSWRQMFAELSRDLGPRYSHLKCSTRPERHGTRTAVLINRIYDDRQTPATIPWRFSTYALNYDPVDFETSGHNWCIKLHINTERMYFSKRSEVVALLKAKLPRLCPVGFRFIDHPRQLVVEHQFTHYGSEVEVVNASRRKLRDLIVATYVVFEAVLLLAEGSVIDDASRSALLSQKAKIYAPAANPHSPVDRVAFNRSIPPRLRAQVIALNKDGRCRICGKICDPKEIHIDHIVSVAEGGLTVLSNLRVACAGCNLARGSGRPRSKVAHIPAKRRNL